MRTLFLLLMAVLVATPCHAATPKPPVEAPSQWTVSGVVENDLFAGEDGRYTNGVRFTLLSPDLDTFADDPIIAEHLDFYTRLFPFAEGEHVQKNVGVSFGQNIYTPDNISIPTLIEDDRPYAGWLYGALALHSKTRTRLSTVELTLGVVVPSALADSTQKWVHETGGFTTPRGWKNQLRDEPGLILSFNQTHRLWETDLGQGLGMDLLPRYGANLGNVLTNATAGAELRLGYHLPSDFGTSLIRPGGGVSAPFSEPEYWGVYGFVSADGQAVARNIFLDGNTWKQSHDVPKNTLVADISSGFAIYVGDVTLSYTHVLRTPEFVYQTKPQYFGSLSLATRF